MNISEIMNVVMYAGLAIAILSFIVITITHNHFYNFISLGGCLLFFAGFSYDYYKTEQTKKYINAEICYQVELTTGETVIGRDRSFTDCNVNIRTVDGVLCIPVYVIKYSKETDPEKCSDIPIIAR
jgi:hypothetical protein